MHGCLCRKRIRGNRMTESIDRELKITRCIDCVHYDEDKMDTTGFCALHQIYRNDSDFCSDGYQWKGDKTK